MPRSPIETAHPVALVGGSDEGLEHLDDVLTRAPTVVAADSGAEHLLARERMPDAVIGDMDSISVAARARIPPERLLHIAEQETTDFEKCLTRVAAPLAIGLGFMGRRVDHALAAFSTLARHPDRPCLLIGGRDVVTLVPPEIELPLAEGERVSLYPLGPVAGRSRGLVWPIDGVALSPARRVGTSNRATGPVWLAADRPELLLILPVERWPLVSERLRDAPRWPARAAG